MTVQSFGLGVAIWIAVLKIFRHFGLRTTNFFGKNRHIRNIFSSRCIELGMDYKTLSEILSHANVSTTMNLYVHLSLTQKKANE